MARNGSKVSIKVPFKKFDLDNRSRSIRHGGVSLLSHQAEVPTIMSPQNLIKMGAKKVEINDAHRVLHDYYEKKYCNKYVR